MLLVLMLYVIEVERYSDDDDDADVSDRGEKV